MHQRQKHKVPLKIYLYRLKNKGFLTIVDKIIYKISPPKKINRAPGKILINRNDRIGDAFVTIPVLRDLKLNYPSLIIDVLCSETNSFAFKDLDYINKIHIYNKNSPPETETKLKAEKYDAVVDLVSMDKKLLRMFKRCTPFVAGSRLFGLSWLYNYYLPTNWVSEYDKIPMSKKIENLLTDCFSYEFKKRSTVQPYKNYPSVKNEIEYDIFFHLGTSEIRKLNKQTEENLLELIKNYRILITDGSNTERYKYYNSKYSTDGKLTFRLYDKLEDTISDVMKSKLVLCYDGGQAHFLSQFTRCITLVGTLSLKQWAPYDFSDYILLKTWTNRVEAYISQGNKRHIAVTFPIWCSPCFSTGCNTRPCINNITTRQIKEIIDDNISETKPIVNLPG